MNLSLYKRGKLADWLFDKSAAGIQLSGDSGSGKSNVAELFAGMFAESGQPFLYIDPHGTSAKRIEQVAWGLPPHRRRKFIVIRPTDLRHLISLNPLAVCRDGLSDLAWGARLISKVGLTSHVLLSAWGETDFNGRPRMYTWITRILKTLAKCGMTIPDARYFLDLHSPLFDALVRAVPDLMARNAFEELARRKPSEVDDQIESTRTRMLGFLENPIVEAMLGRKDGLDFRQIIREGTSIIVDLEPAGLLREEDQTILANLILTEFIYAVMNMPAHERRPYFAIIDELPVFARSSGPLLIRALCEIRKFLTRFILVHQGTQRFPEKTDDAFLNTIVSQCGVRVYFRHVNPKDAEFFGNILSLPSLDPLKIKHVQRTPMQFNIGNELVTLTDTSAGSSVAEQNGTTHSDTTNESTERGEGRTEADGTSNGTTTERDEDRLRESVNEARSRTTSRTSNTSTSSGTSIQNGTSTSTTSTRNTGVTYKQTLIPRIITKNIVTSIQFFSLDEQRQDPATKLAGLGDGAAFVHLSGRGVARVQFPLAKRPFSGTPQFARRKQAEFWRELLKRPEYASPEAILEERERMFDQLLLELQRLAPHETLTFPHEQHCILNQPHPIKHSVLQTPIESTELLIPPTDDDQHAPWTI